MDPVVCVYEKVPEWNELKSMFPAHLDERLEGAIWRKTTAYGIQTNDRPHVHFTLIDVPELLTLSENIGLCRQRSVCSARIEELLTYAKLFPDQIDPGRPIIAYGSSTILDGFEYVAAISRGKDGIKFAVRRMRRILKTQFRILTVRPVQL